MVEMRDVSAALNDPWILNRGDMGAYFNSVPTPKPSSGPASPCGTTVNAGAPAAITDFAGNRWTIVGGQVTLIFPTLVLLVSFLITYINEKSWQEVSLSPAPLLPSLPRNSSINLRTIKICGITAAPTLGNYRLAPASALLEPVPLLPLLHLLPYPVHAALVLPLPPLQPL